MAGYFRTRIPRGWNQVVSSENRRHRGRARGLVGRTLRDALDGLERGVDDLNASFCCRVRADAGARARLVDHEFRVIALRRPDGEYAVYATNAPAHPLPAEEAWNVHRLRWEVETFFETAKSGAALNDTPAGSRHGVDIFIGTALLRATLAMKVKARFVRLVPAMQRPRINPHQWMRWWSRQLHRHLHELLPDDEGLGHAERTALLSDPNRARTPSRSAF